MDYAIPQVGAINEFRIKELFWASKVHIELCYDVGPVSALVGTWSSFEAQPPPRDEKGRAALWIVACRSVERLRAIKAGGMALLLTHSGPMIA